MKKSLVLCCFLRGIEVKRENQIRLSFDRGGTGEPTHLTAEPPAAKSLRPYAIALYAENLRRSAVLFPLNLKEKGNQLEGRDRKEGRKTYLTPVRKL